MPADPREGNNRLDKMEWATWSLLYLGKARKAVHDDFNAAMEELRSYQTARNESWYSRCKNILTTLYHFSLEFVESADIPSERFASPNVFEVELVSLSRLGPSDGR